MNYKEFKKVVHADFKSMKLTTRQKETDEIVDTVFNALIESLKRGHNVDVINLGVFKLIHRRFSNPLTEGEIYRWVVSFGASKLLNKKVNELSK